MVALIFGEPKKIAGLGFTEGVCAQVSAEPMKIVPVLSESNLKFHSADEHVNGGPFDVHLEHGPPGAHFHVAPPGLVRPPPGLLLARCSSECGSTTLPSSSSEFDGVEIIEESDSDSPSHERCTVVMRNVPKQYTRDMLLSMIDNQGFSGTYRLVYLPFNFASGTAVGYAFVSFYHHTDACRFSRSFDGFDDWMLPGSEKACEVEWQDTDDFHAQVKRFRNSPMMHPSVPDGFRPALFDNGVRIAFPAPTRVVKRPRVRLPLEC